MNKLPLFLALVLLACSSEPQVLEQPPDAGSVDATTSDASTSDALVVPDSTPPDAGQPDAQVCKNTTVGLVIGDSIVSDLFTNGKTLLQANGNVVYKLAVAGDTCGDQLGRWAASSFRGDQTIDWIYVQCGINDVLHGQVTAPDVAGNVELLLEDIAENNPRARVYLSNIDPARKKLELVGPTRYPTWLDLSSRLTALGAVSDVSLSLDDGTHALLTQYDNGDGLHPNPAGDLVSTTVLRAWVTSTFSCQ